MFEDYKITLASASPRRKDLLEGLGINFSVEPVKDGNESYDDNIEWNLVPEFLAKHKSQSFHRNLEKNEILITADTLVFLQNEVSGKMEIIGKPADDAEAEMILTKLSGRTHLVLTGVCIRTQDREYTFTETSSVSFCGLSENEIKYYVSNCNPLDKAGAYGIQEWIGYAAITGISGSFYNVMGLPVQRVYRILKEICRKNT